MAIYNINGTELDECYSSDSSLLEYAYDLNSNIVYEANDPYIQGRTLLFEDKFDGDALNPANWSYELGNVRNQELQFYLSQNVSVENNNLVITAKRETYGNKEWTSGSITSQLSHAWTYGRFEAKIKFPNVVGAFGAFWTLGDGFHIIYSDDPQNPDSIADPQNTQRYPECGEIDIIETIPGDTVYPRSTVWNCSASGSLGSGLYRVNSTGEYHIYAMEWTSSYIAMFIDGTEYKRWTFSDYADEVVAGYHLPQYILMDLAVGKAGGDPAESTTEMKMYVDWVRVYAPLQS